MRQSTTGSLLASSIKSFLVATFKLVMILLAWILKIVGVACVKVSEGIEKILNKRS